MSKESAERHPKRNAALDGLATLTWENPSAFNFLRRVDEFFPTITPQEQAALQEEKDKEAKELEEKLQKLITESQEAYRKRVEEGDERYLIAAASRIQASEIDWSARTRNRVTRMIDWHLPESGNSDIRASILRLEELSSLDDSVILVQWAVGKATLSEIRQKFPYSADIPELSREGIDHK